MNIIIDSKSTKPIYEQIYNRIMGEIVAGNLEENQLLPSIRSLAKELGISFITTKRAYEELEKDGLIYTIQGKGCFVSKPNKDLFREINLKEIEKHMDKIADIAIKAGISEKELEKMLAFALQDRSQI